MKKLGIQMKSDPVIQLLITTSRTLSQHSAQILTHMCLLLPCFKEPRNSMSLAALHMKNIEIKCAHVFERILLKCLS